MVSSASIAAMLFSLLVSVGIPVAALIYFLVRYKIKGTAVLTGAAVFFLFSLVLERICHLYFLNLNASSAAFLKNPWAYGVYGALMAGLFEETGRFLAFLLILKKLRGWKDGVAYGIGHGGCESILVGGAGYLNLLIYAGLMNAGVLDKTLGKTLSADTLANIKSSLLHTPLMYTVGGFERIFAFVLQIGLSLLILYGIKNHRYIFLLYAVLIHAAVDFPAALAQKGMLNSWIVEGIVLAAAVLSAFFIVWSRKRWDGSSPAEAAMPER